MVATALAEAPLWIPEAQYRPRWELDTGRDGDPDNGVVSYVTHRARLGGSLSTQDVSFRFVLNDVRTFGEEADTRKDFSADGLDVPIAELDWRVTDRVSVQVGRMQRSIYNERLFAIANWRQPGRSFDGARVAWIGDAVTIEARGLLIREGDDVDFGTRDQVFQDEADGVLLFLTADIAADIAAGALQIRPLVFVNQDQALDLFRVTGGVTGFWETDRIRLEYDVYGQTGQTEDDRIRAGMAHVAATLTPALRGAPTIALWYDILSGDGDADDGVFSTFNTLYGANHKYYGTIDMVTFFVGGPRDGQGLHDPALKLGFAPAKRLTIKLDIHGFFAAAPIDDSFFAVETDASLGVALAERLKLYGGASLWLPADRSGNEGFVYTMLDARL